MSVVIPAYNHGRYVAEAIDSVLAQDYAPIEVIVIDDGSTDETARELARYVNQVSVVSQANAGQATTINRGWQRASGEILSYLSADDRLLPHAVASAVATLYQNPNAVMVYGDYALIDDRSQTIRQVRTADFDYDLMVRELVCAPGPGVFIRRESAERVGGWNARFRVAPDFDLWLRLGLIGPFTHVRKTLAQLRVHGGSTSFGSVDATLAEEPLRIMQHYFARHDLPPRIRAAESHSLSSAHLLAARAHLRAYRLGACLRSMRAAGRLYPRSLLSTRAIRLLVNALFSRPAHIVLRSVRQIGGRRGSSGSHS